MQLIWSQRICVYHAGFIRLHLRFLKVLKIFSGSPWETCRKLARCHYNQKHSIVFLPSWKTTEGVISIETFRSFSEKRKKNDHSLKYLCSFRHKSSRCELSCLRGYYSNMVSGSSAPRVEFGSGRLITSEVYTLVSGTFAYQSPYVNLFLRFAYPQLKNQARKKWIERKTTERSIDVNKQGEISCYAELQERLDRRLLWCKMFLFSIAVWSLF